MVAIQSQNGVTNTFQLAATGRQCQREQAGGIAGTEVFYYDGPGDSPSWTSLGATWSRNVTGIGGELAAVQESNGTTTFKLTDLHGDAVASASASPIATELLATYRFSEFGEPVSGSGGRFGWLGGKSRRTELQSGVIQMGARSYIPQLGRFLTPDPVPGGSDNPYDYADQDPVNIFDLAGECVYGKKHPHCVATQSPKQLRQRTRKANQRKALVTHFKSRGAAERFAHMLQQRPTYAEEIGHWKAQEVLQAERLAAKAEHEEAIFGPRPEPSDSGSCGTAAAISGVAGTVVGFISVVAAPETGGVSLFLGTLSTVTTGGAVSGGC